ncbi:MAG TPA: FxsA family protein [bacterium]|nr:FxsA family protein [bacterium]
MKYWLLGGFFLYTLVEALLLVAVVRWVGVVWALVLLVGSGVLGMALLRLEGLRAVARIQRQLQQEVLPTRELLDLGLILLGAGLLLLPGFVGDTLGLLLLLGPVRQGASWLIFRVLLQHLPNPDPQARLRAAAGNVLEIEQEPQH